MKKTYKITSGEILKLIEDAEMYKDDELELYKKAAYTEKVSYSLLPGGKEMKKKYIKEIVRRLKQLDPEAVELVFRFVKNLKK